VGRGIIVKLWYPYTHCVLFFFISLFHRGSRGLYAYIGVVFATMILASSLGVIRSMLEVREYKSQQIVATPSLIMISGDGIYVLYILRWQLIMPSLQSQSNR